MIEAKPADALALSKGKFRGPVRFYDGRNGWARQDFESLDEPRFGYAWQREHRKDRGRHWFMVDGTEVANFEEADRLLAHKPSPDSPHEKMNAERRLWDESPKIGSGRASNQAECNAAVGPFASVRAAMQRIDHPWHVGINRFNEAEREAGRPFSHLLYNAKTAAHEAYRSMYLWAGDREQDTGLQCLLGVRCRDCPILSSIEASAVESRDADKMGRPDIEIEDIDFAKTWTCIGHMLQSQPGEFVDGAFFTTKADREERHY